MVNFGPNTTGNEVVKALKVFIEGKTCTCLIISLANPMLTGSSRHYRC